MRRPRWGWKWRSIALTYDDGPTEHTAELLELLARQGAGATFFVTGDSINSRPEILKQIASTPGMEIGCHSMTHPDLKTVSDAQVREEIVECQRLVKELTGRPAPLLRPPFGHHDERTARWAHESGQAIIMWTVTSLDWQHESANETAAIVGRAARHGDIVLLHDWVESTVEGTRGVLAALSARGFRFVTVTELLGRVSAGSVYSGRNRVWTRVRRHGGRRLKSQFRSWLNVSDRV